jgi:hypothetical protein
MRLLRLRPAAVRQAGYYAEATLRNGKRERVQIKGRCLTGKISPGARIGAIDLSKPWDVVLLVLLDSDFEAIGIYRAERSAVRAALLAPGSRARNERHQLPISKFKAVGRQVWHRAATAK